MICRDPALSKLDDTLGQLYWKARHRVINRRAFLADSNSKWAWREANCRDAACLGTWYATRIDELQQLIKSLRTGATAMPSSPVRQADPDSAQPAPPMPAPPSTALATLQCTAANPGIVIHAQCPTVLGENGQENGLESGLERGKPSGRQTASSWKPRPHSGDWFCGVAMLPPADISTTAQTEAAQ